VPIPAQRDPAETRRRLAGWLAGRPGITEATVGELEAPAATGFSNETVLFDATWREGGRPVQARLVARIQPRHHAVFPDLDVSRQYRVMAALAGTDVPVPRLRWLEDDPAVLGTPFFVMDRIEGRIPSDTPPYSQEGFLVEATPAQRARLWCSGVDALVAVHRVDWRARRLDALLRPDGQVGVDAELRRWRAYLDWASPDAPVPVAEAAWRWLLAHRPDDPPEGPALCWGDARISNQVFADFRCVGVLDWEMATIGDPRMDLGWWIFLDRHFTEALGVARLAGMPSYDETVARWEAATGRRADPDAVRFWEVFAGFRFAAIMARLARLLADWAVLPMEAGFATDNPATQLLARMLDPEAPSGSDAG
jgi:aminoglycoside phosphotransferase (APT) family kinase protein